MKAMRHAMILQLIDTMEIDTQEMLADQLMARGIKVTQATISRDIKELRLIKVLSDHGTYKYATAERADRNISDRMIRIFSESVVSMIEAENLIVIKTLPASANVAAEAIDSLNWSEIAGTLAGENSIFVALKSRDMVPTILSRFRAMMK
ncbi:MAG: arginine repressor [Clostridia bacterium]|nr:arginine repressor [Clostridia bacterium]MBO4886553.1 arginine repressor [Clostridia bacterium]MBR4443995.1 arginine repressor [Clostridia bacterium]